MLPAEFTDRLLATTLNWEGIRETNDPLDRGGATKYGISLRACAKMRDENGKLYLDFDGDGVVTEDDIERLDWPTACRIYLGEYLYKPHIDCLPPAAVGIAFDWAVNSGPGVSVEHVQRVVNKAGFGPIKEDGACGPVTQRKAAQAAAAMGPYFVNAICDERIAFLEDVIRIHPTDKKFRKGWLRRANSFKEPV